MVQYFHKWVLFWTFLSPAVFTHSSYCVVGTREWQSWHRVCRNAASFATCYSALSGHASQVQDITFCGSLKSCQPVESVLVQSAEITWTHRFLGFWTSVSKSEGACWVCQAPLVSAAAGWDSHHMVTFKYCREEERKIKNNNLPDSFCMLMSQFCFIRGFKKSGASWGTKRTCGENHK